jgi:hypothetical protein
MSLEQPQIDNRLVASVLSRGIWLGVIKRQTVIAWADYLIAQTEIPPGWMIDLSLSQDLDELDVNAILDRIGTGADPAAMCRAMYGFLETPSGQTFEEAERFARHLYDIARACLNMDWNSSMLVEADQINDIFLLIRDGSTNMPKLRAVEEVRTFLEGNRDMRVRTFLDECVRAQQQPIK